MLFYVDPRIPVLCPDGLRRGLADNTPTPTITTTTTTANTTTTTAMVLLHIIATKPPPPPPVPPPFAGWEWEHELQSKEHEGGDRPAAPGTLMKDAPAETETGQSLIPGTWLKTCFEVMWVLQG